MGNFNRFGSNNRSGGRDSGRHNTFGPRDGGARLMMHPAVCDDCGKNCEVPFKPTGNREIFCSDCFEKRGGKDSLPPRNDERNYNRFDREDRAPRNDGYDRNERPNSNFDRNERPAEREMFSAICDDCGKDCELPFKPSSSKPVYCSRCFEARGEKSGIRNDRGDSRSDGGKSKEIGELKAEIISMNAKLEKIMKAMNIVSEKEVAQPEVAQTVQTEVAEVVAQKVNGPKSKVAKKAKKAEKVIKEVAPVAEVLEVKVAVAKKKAVKKVSAKKTK